MRLKPTEWRIAHGDCGSRRGTRPTFAPVVDSARAVLTSGTWLKACGVLPSCRLATGSHSSESSPTSLRRSSSRSKISRASRLPPDQVQVVGQPERAGEERAFGAAQTVAGRRGVVAQDEAVVGEVARDRLDGADHPRVVRRQEPDLRDEQGRGVEGRRAVGLGEGVAVGVEALLGRPPRGCVSRAARQRSTGPLRPNCSTARTARSKPTQAMTFECTKCRGSPRISHSDWSGSSQLPSSSSSTTRCNAQALSCALRPDARSRCSASSSSPYTSSWNCPDASLPTRTGVEPS